MERKPIRTKAEYIAAWREMEKRGLTRKNLEQYIGSRGRVAEALNRACPLTPAMIRRLSQGLKLPADVLISDYELRYAA